MFSCVTCAIEGKNESAEEEVITLNDVTRTRYYLCTKHRLELQDFILRRGRFGKAYKERTDVER